MKSLRVDDPVVRAVTEALEKAFEIQLKMPIQILSVSNTPPITPLVDAGAVIHFVDRTTKGKIRLLFSREFSESLFKVMVGATEGTSSIDHPEAGSEMLNIVYTSARTAINHLGYEFGLAIPQVISKPTNGLLETWSDAVRIVSLSEIGDFSTEISFAKVG